MPTYNNKNIVLHELVGLEAEVASSSDRSQIGMKGTVLRETRNTLEIVSGGRKRKVIKKNSTFRFSCGDQDFVVNGEEISFRSHERTGKALKFYKKRKL